MTEFKWVKCEGCSVEPVNIANPAFADRLCGPCVRIIAHRMGAAGFAPRSTTHGALDLNDPRTAVAVDQWLAGRTPTQE
jgi:hypothetical protein